jgi:hypothetical protein
LARRYSSRAIERLSWLMEHGKPDAVQVAACTAILDRGFGRPLQSLQTEGQVGNLIVNIIRNPQPARPAEARGDRPVPPHAPVAALGDGSEPGSTLLADWLEWLPEDERSILQILAKAYPDPVERDALSAAANFRRATLDMYLQRLVSRHLVTSEGRSAVRAAPELFR